MNVDKALIESVAKNARIDLDSSEVKEFIPQFNEVLELFSLLEEVDTDGVEPSFQPVKIMNSLRDDVPEKSLSQSDALKNTSLKKDGYFLGPKVGGL